jgi:S1-C subfamily serine protease
MVFSVLIAWTAFDSWATATVDGSGELRARAILVASDLSLKPIPKRQFLIVAAEDGQETISVTTSFDGEMIVPLRPGKYWLRTTDPLEFENRLYSWDVEFEILSGSTTSLDLSNDNAIVVVAQEDLSDQGTIYEENRGGVFKVISDGMHGSGFLVDKKGLILTNHHVVAEAEYLAVKLDDRHKHKAVVLAEDPGHDIVVLWIHPDTVRNRPVLKLADDSAEEPTISVGDEVLAIGSPLTTDTILTAGIVSKVEADSLYSDVSINPGNSGGPLFDSRGRVVGISTFGVQSERGPGVSGITRIHLAFPLLQEARREAESTAAPPARQLPVESTYRFSPESVKNMALASDPEVKDYHLEAGKLDVHFFTPVLMAARVIRAEREAMEGRQKRRKKKGTASEEEPYEPGQRFYEWQKDSDNFRPVVRVRVYPEVKMKAGSVFKSLGTSAKYRFKTDFLRMELRRDGVVVEPILPGRIKEVANVQRGTASLKDVGYWGYYEYPPEAFAPGATVTLHIWEQDTPDPQVLDLPDAVYLRIQADLGPYFDSMDADVGHEAP